MAVEISPVKCNGIKQMSSDPRVGCGERQVVGAKGVYRLDSSEISPVKWNGIKEMG